MTEDEMLAKAREIADAVPHADHCCGECDCDRDERIALAALRSAGEWRSIESAPYSTPVRVKAGDMTFIASLEPDVSMDEHGSECDQWHATNEGEHPPCWSGGACWQSNEDEALSLQPCAWQPLPAPPAPEPSR